MILVIMDINILRYNMKIPIFIFLMKLDKIFKIIYLMVQKFE